MTIDIAAFRLQDNALAVQQLAGPGDRGITITGAAKLGQRVVLELMTERGSIPYLKDRGTRLVTKMRSGRIRTEFDLFVAFAAASLDVSRNLRSEETEDDPEDERFKSMKCLSLALTREGGAILEFVVTSVSKKFSNIRLPINVKL